MKGIAGIEITDVKINPVKKLIGNHLVATARIIFNGVFCVSNIRVLSGKFGPFISFPREFMIEGEGKVYSICYPITKAMQDYISAKVLEKWREMKQVT